MGMHYRTDEYVGVIDYGDDGEWVGGVEVEYGKDEWPCTWHVRVVTEDGYGEKPCGAPANDTKDGGYACRVGHEFVPAEVRFREGWEYSESPQESARLRALGVDVVECY